MYYVNGPVLSRVLHLGATYAKLLSHTKITIFPQCSLVCSRKEVRISLSCKLLPLYGVANEESDILNHPICEYTAFVSFGSSVKLLVRELTP